MSDQVEVLEAPSGPSERELRDTVLGFFTLEGLHRGLSVGQWSIELEVEMLAGIAADRGLDPLIRIAAVKLIREHLKDALRFEGVLQETTAGQYRMLPDGTVQSAQVSGARLAHSPLIGPPRTQRMLESALSSPNIVAPQRDRYRRQDRGGGGNPTNHCQGGQS